MGMEAAMTTLRRIVDDPDTLEELLTDGYTGFSVSPDESSLEDLVKEFSNSDFSIRSGDRKWYPTLTVPLKETAQFLDESSIAESLDLDEDSEPTFWLVPNLNENYTHAHYAKKVSWFSDEGLYCYYVVVKYPSLNMRYLLIERDDLGEILV